MKKLAAVAAPVLLATLTSSCIFTPLHEDRRQTTVWAVDLFYGEVHETEGPSGAQVGTQIANVVGSIFFVPVAWIWDSAIVNPFDSMFDASADVYDVVWYKLPETQELYEERTYYDGNEYTRAQHDFTRLPRYITGTFVWLGDVLVRANVPVGPRGFGRYYDVNSDKIANPWHFDKEGYQPREYGSGKNVFWQTDEMSEAGG